MTVPSPLIELAGGHEAWLASRSGSFRRRMRQLWRRLEARGASWRRTSAADELPRDLAAFARLHRARWDFRGGSGVLTPGVEAMVAQAGPRAAAERSGFRLWSLEAEGEIVCSQLFLAAGRRSGWWLGGFDPEWARESPTLALLDRIVADAFARDEDVLDLGAGRPGVQAPLRHRRGARRLEPRAADRGPRPPRGRRRAGRGAASPTSCGGTS